MPRGPYKTYEHDPGISVPKSTHFNRRKRRLEFDGNDDDTQDQQLIQLPLEQEQSERDHVNNNTVMQPNCSIYGDILTISSLLDFIKLRCNLINCPG